MSADDAAALVDRFRRLQHEVREKVLDASLALITTGQPLPNLRAQLPELPAHDVLHGPPSQDEVTAYARYLGMDVEHDADLLYIAEWALTAPVPEGWTVHLDQEGHEFFFNAGSNKSQYEHPMDEHYKELYARAKHEKAASGGKLHTPLDAVASPSSAAPAVA